MSERERDTNMGESKIEWTDYTFNPWIGCTKISQGCKFCYADRQNNRYNWNPAGWGPGAPRKRTSEANWKKPITWDRQADRDGTHPLVFSASLADIADPEVSIDWKRDMFQLIEVCRELRWLLLSKRIELFNGMLEEAMQMPAEKWLADNPHVGVGTSIEDQPNADKRVPELLKVKAAIRFISAEPLLGPILLDDGSNSWLTCNGRNQSGIEGEHVCCESYDVTGEHFHGIDWVIVGGESGPNARPMHPDWARSIGDQCQAANVKFLFKQWGEWALKGSTGAHSTDYGVLAPDGTWYHQHTGWNGRPIDPDTNEAYMVKVGKKAAGRMLDGQKWNEFPEWSK